MGWGAIKAVSQQNTRVRSNAIGFKGLRVQFWQRGQ